MTRILIRPIRGRGPPRERVAKVRTPSGVMRAQKTPEEIAKEREEVFRKSGCRRQYIECPSVPSFENSECCKCPHFPEKFKR